MIRFGKSIRDFIDTPTMLDADSVTPTPRFCVLRVILSYPYNVVCVLAPALFVITVQNIYVLFREQSFPDLVLLLP